MPIDAESMCPPMTQRGCEKGAAGAPNTKVDVAPKLPTIITKSEPVMWNKADSVPTSRAPQVDTVVAIKICGHAHVSLLRKSSVPTPRIRTSNYIHVHLYLHTKVVYEYVYIPIPRKQPSPVNAASIDGPAC